MIYVLFIHVFLYDNVSCRLVVWFKYVHEMIYFSEVGKCLVRCGASDGHMA